MTNYRRNRRTAAPVANPTEQTAIQLDTFRQFREEILPQLQTDVANGLTAEDLAKKYSNLALARLISVMATAEDDSKAIAAAKEVLDRGIGKSVERKKIEHSLKEIPDEQLDALLLSELQDIEDAEYKEIDE